MNNDSKLTWTIIGTLLASGILSLGVCFLYHQRIATNLIKEQVKEEVERYHTSNRLFLLSPKEVSPNDSFKIVPLGKRQFKYDIIMDSRHAIIGVHIRFAGGDQEYMAEIEVEGHARKSFVLERGDGPAFLDLGPSLRNESERPLSYDHF